MSKKRFCPQRRNILADFYGFRPRPEYMGIAFAHCWLFSMQRTLSPKTPHAFQATLFFGLVSACLILGATSLIRRKGNASSRVASVAVWGLIGVTSTFLIISGVAERMGSSAELAIAFACGFAIGGCYLAWGGFYSRVDIRQALAILFCSIALGSAMKVAYSLLGRGTPEAVAFCALPIACLGCWSAACRHVPGRRLDPAPIASRDRSIWRGYALGVFAFGVAIGVSRLVDDEFFSLTALDSIVAHAIEIVVCLFIVVCVGLQRMELEFSNMWMLILIVYATGLVVLECVPEGLYGGATAIMTAAQMLVVTFYWLALCDIAQRSPLASDVVFGLGYPIYMLPMAVVSSGAVEGLRDLGRMPVLVMYGLMLSVYLFMRRRPYGRPALFSGLLLSSPSDVDTIEQRVHMLASRYGLSEREYEVTCLYAQGRSRAFIGGELCLSENTVRDHISHVYKKLGIHNKQDLIDMISK